MRLSQIITDYHKSEALPLMKCIRRVEWAGDHFGLWFDVNRSFLTKTCAKTVFTFSFSVTLTFALFRPKICSPS